MKYELDILFLPSIFGTISNLSTFLFILLKFVC